MTTLLKIRKKVRRLTASPSPLQLSDADIDEYIDTFYEQDLPAELKLWQLHKTYTFYTKGNEDQYTLPVNEILGINPPVYIAGYECFYTQSPQQFYRIYPKVQYEQNLGNGDGSAGAYPFTLTNVPVLRRSFSVTAVDSNNVTRTLVDIPTTEVGGNLVAQGTTAPALGTINYVTGAINITNFGDTIPVANPITAFYYPYVASRPTAFLLYSNTITLRPVPDQSYQVEVEAFVKPTQLLDSDDDSPDIHQWWQYLAFGAAFKVLEDRQDTETMAALAPRLDEQKQLVLHRTILQQTPERTATIYTEQVTNFLGNPYRGGF